jgi:tetratricopeptide (TPR) repeat protein
LNIGPGACRDIDSEVSYGIPICGGCGGLGFIVDTEDFLARAREIARARSAYCPSDGPRPPDVLMLGALEALVREVKEHYRLYGDARKVCFAAEIAAGCLDQIIASGRIEVERRLEKARRAGPDLDPGAMAGRPAIIASLEGKLDEADALFRKTLAHYPESSVVAHDYGVFLSNYRRDLEQAMPWFLRSCALTPRRAVHFWQTAVALAALNRNAEAIDKVRACMTCPDFDALPAGIRDVVAALRHRGVGQA